MGMIKPDKISCYLPKYKSQCMSLALALAMVLLRINEQKLDALACIALLLI